MANRDTEPQSSKKAFNDVIISSQLDRILSMLTALRNDFANHFHTGATTILISNTIAPSLVGSITANAVSTPVNWLA